MPSAAKWASAAANCPAAMLHSATVSISVPSVASHFLAPMRRPARLQAAAKTVRSRAKKLPNGRVKHPARASSGASTPVQPCASIPQRANTNQTANRCQTSSCIMLRNQKCPCTASEADNTSQHAAQRGVSLAAGRLHARAAASTAARNSNANKTIAPPRGHSPGSVRMPDQPNRMQRV